MAEIKVIKVDLSDTVLRDLASASSDLDDARRFVTKFEVGRSYFCRSFGDYNCVWTFEVVAHTAKFVTLREVTVGDYDYGKVRRVGVRVWDGVEVCSPLGRYSLSPVLSADREEVSA